jgi:hypothetical protein
VYFEVVPNGAVVETRAADGYQKLASPLRSRLARRRAALSALRGKKYLVRMT